MNSVRDRIGFPIKMSRLIDEDHGLNVGVESAHEFRQRAVELRDIGVLGEFSTGNNLCDERDHTGVYRANVADQSLGRRDDARNRLLLVEMIMTSMEQNNVSRGFREVRWYGVSGGAPRVPTNAKTKPAARSFSANSGR